MTDDTGTLDTAASGQNNLLEALEERAETKRADETGDRWEMDWIDGEEVIVQEQRAIAVYRNSANGVVIRAEAGMYEGDDQVIVVSTDQAVRTLIVALEHELRAGK